jgi:hypothetical protein
MTCRFYQTLFSSRPRSVSQLPIFAASVHIGDRRYRRSAARSKVYQRTELIRIGHQGEIDHFFAMRPRIVIRKGHDDADASTN